MCHHVGCTKRPVCGGAGTNKADFCAGHKKEGMVDVKDKRCAHVGCTRRQVYGVAGTSRREFCSGHKKEGMYGGCQVQEVRSC